MSEECLAALSLLQVPDATPTQLRLVYEAYGSFNVFSQANQSPADPRLLRLARAYRSRPEYFQAQAKKVLDALVHRGGTILCLADSDYPRLLQEIHRPPVVLYVQGPASSLSLPQLAIVGSRHASASALELAKLFASELAAAGFVIVSGMALGIDAAAHWGALSRGLTVGVLGTGIDLVYPRGHAGLYHEVIAKGGTLVTEFPPGCPARSANFPQRNRIISGLSLGVLVVEAAVRSGSLITARCAMDQGREVFAIPGSINNPRARGCHQLIREGATLVETADDIVSQMTGMLAYKREELATGPDDQAIMEGDAGRLLAAMDFEATTLDVLGQRLAVPAGELLALLMELELRGLVEQQGGLYCRIR